MRQREIFNWIKSVWPRVGWQCPEGATQHWGPIGGLCSHQPLFSFQPSLTLARSADLHSLRTRCMWTALS